MTARTEVSPATATPPAAAFTVDQLIRELKVFTDAQRCLAFCPLPKRESWPSDCRFGGNAGLNFNHDELYYAVIQARFRYLAEQKKLERQVA